MTNHSHDHRMPQPSHSFRHRAVMMMMMLCLLFSLGQWCVTVDAFSVVVPTASTRSSSPSSFSLHMSSITASNNEPSTITTSPSIIDTTTTRENDNIETNVYLTNLVQTRTDWMELPASFSMSRRSPETTTPFDRYEQVLGRFAMMGAVAMALREWNDGSSIMEQVMTLVVS